GGLTAADNTGAGAGGARLNQLFETQDGLDYLSKQTGGFLVRDTNDLNRGIQRVMDDLRGYYLPGYVPEKSSFGGAGGPTRYHRIKVGIKRAGLHVRSRTGFYGVSDEVLRRAEPDPDRELLQALYSPFSGGDIGLRLTSIFGHDAKAGSFMRSLLHID